MWDQYACTYQHVYRCIHVCIDTIICTTILKMEKEVWGNNNLIQSGIEHPVFCIRNGTSFIPLSGRKGFAQLENGMWSSEVQIWLWPNFLLSLFLCKNNVHKEIQREHIKVSHSTSQWTWIWYQVISGESQGLPTRNAFYDACVIS